MNVFVDGGTSAVFPGSAVTLTRTTGTTETSLSVGYMSFPLAASPVKPHGAPDTSWQLVSSTFQSVFAAVDVTRGVPLDSAGHILFRYGGAVGVGYFFTGGLHRNQLYPPKGKPGDPSTYKVCSGPNNPWGTYAYCNTSDGEANLYGNYTEPDWFHGGLIPAPYPWLVLPQLGLSWNVSTSLTIDLATGMSLAGILTSLGVRFGL